MKYLVTGGSGRLGTHLCKKISCITPTSKELDILNVDQVEKHISLKEADAVLHMAAICDMSVTEKEKEKTYWVNVQGTRNIAASAKKFNKKIVFISTDRVFSCTKGDYKETDPRDPIDWYGFTKTAGELEVQNATANHLIIRLSFRQSAWPFPTAYDDVYTNADYVDVIADELALCLNKAPELTGILHLGTKKKTYYELAKKRNPAVLPEQSLNYGNRRDFCLDKWESIKKSLLD